MAEISRKQLEKLFSKEYLDSVSHDEAVARYLRKVEGMSLETKTALGLIKSKDKTEKPETVPELSAPTTPKKSK